MMTKSSGALHYTVSSKGLTLASVINIHRGMSESVVAVISLRAITVRWVNSAQCPLPDSAARGQVRSVMTAAAAAAAARHPDIDYWCYIVIDGFERLVDRARSSSTSVNDYELRIRRQKTPRNALRVSTWMCEWQWIGTGLYSGSGIPRCSSCIGQWVTFPVLQILKFRLKFEQPNSDFPQLIPHGSVYFLYRSNRLGRRVFISQVFRRHKSRNHQFI